MYSDPESGTGCIFCIVIAARPILTHFNIER